MCLVGEKGVGKSSLLHFLIGDSMNVNQFSDVCINQYKAILKDSTQSQQFRIWDICGECNYLHFILYPIVSYSPYSALYYQEAQVILLCYAINSSVHFISIR